MHKVAGTRIETATDDDRWRTLLISDLHIPATGGEVLEQFRAVLEDARTAPPETRLVVLGDMFEAFVGPKQARVGVWKQVCELLRETVEAGVSISLLWGNRDFMLDEVFGQMAGSRVVPGGLQLHLDGVSTMLLHGDELCLNDLPYQRSKRFLRSWGFRSFTSRLPLWAQMQIASTIRKKSKATVRKGDPQRFDPVASAVREAFAAGAQILVFGHIHLPARGRFEDRGEYVILPAFDEMGVFLEHRDGKLFYRDVAGKEVPDFPPRDFP
ncbi:MAG: UDP-2,3-diacylglucosamine diphosphatase [Planctomycetota bacterium]|jgi:UDP-2,3-diacylglucosamine hydrolase